MKVISDFISSAVGGGLATSDEEKLESEILHFLDQ
jgi:hypothetical protein